MQMMRDHIQNLDHSARRYVKYLVPNPKHTVHPISTSLIRSKRIICHRQIPFPIWIEYAYSTRNCCQFFVYYCWLWENNRSKCLVYTHKPASRFNSIHYRSKPDRFYSRIKSDEFTHSITELKSSNRTVLTLIVDRRRRRPRFDCSIPADLVFLSLCVLGSELDVSWNRRWEWESLNRKTFRRDNWLVLISTE